MAYFVKLGEGRVYARADGMEVLQTSNPFEEWDKDTIVESSAPIMPVFVDEIEAYCKIMGWDFSIVGEDIVIKTRVIGKAVVI